MADSKAIQYVDVSAGPGVSFSLPITESVAEPLRSGRVPMVEEAPASLPTPPLFEQNPNWVQPLQERSPSVRMSATAEAFVMPAELHRVVSPSHPVRVEIASAPEALEDAFVVFPMAYDDEYFYLAGPPVKPEDQVLEKRLSNTIALEVTRLPDLDDEPPAPPDAARTRLGVFRALKLGFFKMVGIPSADVGLRVPSLAGNRVEYRAVQPGELRDGRIALLTHGFLSDTAWMVHGLLASLRAAGYDRVVTWDYETFTTPIRETQAGLVRLLREAGAAPGSERLDVIAHSMGTLVTRSLVADTALGLVRRALLLGPPNAGTPIARVADRVTGLASSLINVELGPVSLRKVVRFLWEAIDNGLDDLQPGSDFLRWVNSGADRQAAALTIVAGNNSGGRLGTVFRRALHGAVGLYYGGPNDLVVPVASMRSVATPPYPRVAYGEVDSNHFDYLVARPARAVVDRWVANP
jgi:pimeloyl-ACP methyl ester carboxylesterase